MDRITSPADLESARSRIVSSRDPDRLRITVCGGTGCRANGSLELSEALRGELDANGRQDVEIMLSGCHGFCQQGPVVVVDPQGIFYRMVGLEDRERDVRDIVQKNIIGGDPVERLLYIDPRTGEKTLRYSEIPFYAKQKRIALRNNGKIDPNNIEDYIAADGYAALAKVIATDPEEVIDWVTRSGLRGRGGGGFPTGKKWSFCRAARDTSMRYIICNADEGDPGAFMDRSIMEGDPHSVLEGMAIGAYAMSKGTCPAEGYIYIRAEYPLAVTNVRLAIQQAEELGVLGDYILGTDFSFHVKVKEGAGAFVCGEETALIASIEGRRGMPRTRPPFPANSGLFGKPSNINNVETWANIPKIVTEGPDWYASIGTETSRGTKVFSLVGKVRNSGLVEVPMGMPLQEIVFDIGGGIPDDKRIKAVQTGGPSGGCIPAGMLDIPVDYEKLTEAGAIMGSGGLVVMDEDTCMVDIARYFIEFTQSESCGKCVPCRLGTMQMLSILNRITAGEGDLKDIDLLGEICAAVKEGSLCGLGQTAPNPVLTTIKYFRDEYESHIVKKKCPAVVCRGLVEAPCKHTCPAGIDVPRYVRFIAAGRYADALDVIREKIPFPSICGYVCFHPCETKCRRSQLDDPVAVRALKRVAAEYGSRRRRKRTPRAEPTGKKIAVIGSGPAGLTAGFYLGKLGHEVTVFERESKPGGTLRTGIPGFRLPREVIDREIQQIKKESGLRIRTKSDVKSADALLREGFDAVLLSHGAQKGLTMGIEGEDLSGVYDCLSFLRKVNAGEKVNVGGRVAVVGGGNAAMDAARSALRCGAGEVTIVYRRTRKDMPSGEEELEEALEEGVKTEFLTNPTRIEKRNGGLVLHCVRMEPGPIDSSGRPRPVPIEGSDFEMEFDSIIMAIGQTPEDIPTLGCLADKRGRIQADEDTLETSLPGVFAAGDAVTGPASVIEAIAAGRDAACSIDRSLGGSGDIEEVLAPTEEEAGEMLEEEEERRRTEIPKRPAAERVADGGEVELSYTMEDAIAEAGRCLRCDLEEMEED
jgi:NADH-quinone oxidoreductase subunit F